MREIKILETNLINKIAAGEVVERPASIVKELVENSIDAGSKNILVEIKNGGTSYIKVQDDGDGIEKEQIKTAFLRHATSKLRDLEDLDCILTLGFRGEALSSIASISMLEMITKTKDEQIANKIFIEGGKIKKEEEVAGLNGTTFIIKNIFFNTPARRKFLKKDSVEGGYVSDIVTRLALAHPEICFKYINNGVEILKTDGDNNLKNTIFNVYGKEVAKKLISLNEAKNGFNIDGFIVLPELSRGNRSYENFFINGRYIKSSIVQSAIEDGYGDKLMMGKFPIFILNMTVPKNSVDVNVHPTKLEVRFADENFIYNFLSSSVEKALKNEILIPDIKIEEKKNFIDVAETTPFNTEAQKTLEDILVCDNFDNSKNLEENILIEEDEDFTYEDKKISKPLLVEEVTESSLCDLKNNNKSVIDIVYENLEKDFKEDLEEEKIIIKDININEKYDLIEEDEENFISNQDIQYKEKIVEKENTTKQTKNNFFNSYKVVGQIFNTYWIVEQGKEIFLIDQHSAHERAIYEKLKSEYENMSVDSQILLEPIIINANEKEKAIIEENKQLLLDFGFEIEDFGYTTYAIRKVPFIFKSPVDGKFFTEILDTLADKKIANIYDMKVEKIISMSCKKAVKANDKLSFAEAKALIDNILKLDNPFSCPHGRPTIIKMTKYEIEKMFKRIQN